MKKLLKLLILINALTHISAGVGEKYSRLEALGKNCIAFMQRVGTEETANYESQASEIFAENVSKIVNDKQILTTRAELLAQLRNAREKAFSFTFEIKTIMCDTQKNICIIRFIWNSEKVGMHTTMVSLKFDEDNKIIEIDEVYNTVGIHLSTPQKSIADLANAYNDFQQSYGQSEDKNYAEIIEGLFSPGFQKIVNREVKVDGRDVLELQLKGVRDAVTSWTIEVKEIIPSADNKKCTVRFVLRTPDKGNYDVLKVLSSENGITIDKVDEVFDIIK